jgi:hypothetical protein
MAYYQSMASKRSVLNAALLISSRLLMTIITMEYEDSFLQNVEFDKRSLSIVSYNCRGYNSAKSNHLNNLLATCDILFLQEHWLPDDQLVKLVQLNGQFLSHGVNGFDNSGVLSGQWTPIRRLRHIVAGRYADTRRTCEN